MLSSVKKKTNPSFAVKLAERSNYSLLLFIWWITFYIHLYSLTRVTEWAEFNWLFKHMKKVRSSQAAILLLVEWIVPNYWIFPVSMVEIFIVDKPANIRVIPCLIWEKALSLFQVAWKRCHNDGVICQLAVTILCRLSFSCSLTIFL